MQLVVLPRESRNVVVNVPTVVVAQWATKGVPFQASLARDIDKYGLHRPLTAKYQGGRWRLLEGHHRLAAIQHLGWPEVPVEMSPADAGLVGFAQPLEP